jgi:hypothetical protein
LNSSLNVRRFFFVPMKPLERLFAASVKVSGKPVQAHPYSNVTSTYGSDGRSATTIYNPYSHSSSTYSSSGDSYHTIYNPYSNTSTTYGSNGYQQHCYFSQFAGTIQCY